MDLTKSAEPRSDQQNYDDYISGPKTVTVTEVKSGTPEQPVEVHLEGFPGRPFKPSKSMLRELIAAWGANTKVYAGRQLTLFGDPTVKFGKDAVGGIRISHLSHITGPLTIPLTVTRGKRAPFTVQPIVPEFDEGVVQEVLADVAGAESLPALKAAWDLAGVRGVQKHPGVLEATNKRKAEIADV